MIDTNQQHPEGKEQVDYQAALDYILSFADYERMPRSALVFDLRRMELLLERLGNPQEAARSIHVAGTKGKGSTVAMIASILTCAGYRTGLYASPHLLSFTERIQVDGKPIAEDAFARLVELIKPEVEAVNEFGAFGELTTFEILTALAFAYFKEREADYQVLEVGLGGRLDATNVVKPEVCVITSVSFDHVDVLGDTLSQIATEKAGIIKPGSIVLCSPQSPEAMEVVERVCRERGVRLVRVGSDVTWQQKVFSPEGQSFQLKGITGEYDLYMGVFDGDSSLGFDDFENNSNKFFLYNNTSPTIDDITLGRSVVNTYGNDSSRLSIIFSDPDGESMGNFTVNLTLRDPDGDIFILVDGENEGPNASMPYLSPVDDRSYVFTYDIDPDASFTEGRYQLAFSVRDHWGGTDQIAGGENDLNLTFFYNCIPSPPSKIWPNSTGDTLPLISWWGALDQETPYEELEYSIRIGTTGVDDNVLPWHDTGHSTTYQVTEELGVGVYHIQVRCNDGDFYSDIFSSVMTITSGGNRPPGVPGAINPLYTVSRDPTITWGASTDRDVNDLIEYFISIGTDWHGSDIIKSTPTSVNTIYQLPFMLPHGTYYVQVIATDGHEFSPVREQRMIIFDPLENIAPFPPGSLTPGETRDPYPCIRWEGAADLN